MAADLHNVTAPPSFTELVSDRLRIRRFAATDAQRLHEYRSDPRAMAMQGWEQSTLDDAAAFAAACADDSPGQRNEWFQFAVADRASDLLLGDVGMHTSGDATTGRLGITMHPDQRGTGVAAEAVNAVLDYGFEHLGYERFAAGTLATNLGSMRLLVACGFEHAGQEPVAEDVNGETVFEHEFELRVSDRARRDSAPIVGVLVGGQSTRMGTDKASVVLRGRSMLAHVLVAVDAAGLEVVLLGPDDKGTGRRAVPDGDHGGLGPMVGLRALHEATPARPVILLATDQPLIRPTTILQLAMRQDAPAVVPVDGEGFAQVTCARYSSAAIGTAVEQNIERLRDLLDLDGAELIEPATWRTWNEDGQSFRSLDRPEDVSSVEAEE